MIDKAPTHISIPRNLDFLIDCELDRLKGIFTKKSTFIDKIYNLDILDNNGCLNYIFSDIKSNSYNVSNNLSSIIATANIDDYYNKVRIAGNSRLYIYYKYDVKILIKKIKTFFLLPDYIRERMLFDNVLNLLKVLSKNEEYNQNELFLNDINYYYNKNITIYRKIIDYSTIMLSDNNHQFCYINTFIIDNHSYFLLLDLNSNRIIKKNVKELDKLTIKDDNVNIKLDLGKIYSIYTNILYNPSSLTQYSFTLEKEEKFISIYKYFDKYITIDKTNDGYTITGKNDVVDIIKKIME